jgi:aminoglycoside phosphotransferase (APT) family kinase protein
LPCADSAHGNAHFGNFLRPPSSPVIAVADAAGARLAHPTMALNAAAAAATGAASWTDAANDL